jgi:hypothetical protein
VSTVNLPSALNMCAFPFESRRSPNKSAALM